MPISVLDSRPVQMNVRMDRQLKEAGDAVLAHIGMTPSQAVRELWQYLTENGHMPVAKKNDDEVLPDDIRSKVSSSRVSEGAALISNFYERFSIQRPSPDEAFDYDELYDQMTVSYTHLDVYKRQDHGRARCRPVADRHVRIVPTDRPSRRFCPAG